MNGYWEYSVGYFVDDKFSSVVTIWTPQQWEVETTHELLRDEYPEVDYRQVRRWVGEVREVGQ